MSSSGSHRPSLEALRKRAKDLRRAFRAGDLDAVRQVRSVPELAALDVTSPFTLALAMLVVAREQGFASWPRLKHSVELRDAAPEARGDWLVTSALSGDLRTAARVAAEEPSLATSFLAVACVLGEVGAVESLVEADPALARSAVGPRRCGALWYVSWSRFLGGDPTRAGRLLDAARVLIAAGADANAAARTEDHGAEPKTALYGASGINRHAGMTRLLLDAGADPNCPEALYHACETNDLACLRVILEARPRPDNVSYCLARKLDFEDVAGARLLLDHGADPNFRTPHGERGSRLHHAIARDRSMEVITLLLDRGADPAVRDGLGRTSYVLAVQRGRDDVASELAARGAATELSDSDRFLAACARGDEPAARSLVATKPDLVTALAPHERAGVVAAASRGAVGAVRTMLDAGFDPAWTDEHGATALHVAAFRGDLSLVRLLLGRGAPIEVRDAVYDGTPLGWAVASSAESGVERGSPGDLPGVVSALLGAGATAPERVGGSGEVRKLLRRHLRRRAADSGPDARADQDRRTSRP
jgi:ankyrin repeat protein